MRKRESPEDAERTSPANRAEKAVVAAEETKAKRARVAAPGAAGVADGVSYRVEGGLRHVEPYDFDFTTHAKLRWVGRQLLEVFAREFLAYSQEYYQAAIESGHITVDGKKVSTDHILQQNQRIIHRAVRCQENPVLDKGPIRIVSEDEELLVVDKPSSLPIHPCGSYRFNSLVSLIRAQAVVAQEAMLHTTHRLDRLTSGVVILAKTKTGARRISQYFSQNEIQKTYLARVKGSLADFQALLGDGNGTSPSSPALPSGVSHVTVDDKPRVRVKGFMRCVCHKVGRHAFTAECRPEDGGEPKSAATDFEAVCDVGGGECVLRCLPTTGRTHQIRVQLQHLGFPIANDSCYGGELRNDPHMPLIPHVHQAGSVAAAKKSDKAGDAASEVEQMHPSGIFLHALTYMLPDGVSFNSDPPDWAKSS